MNSYDTTNLDGVYGICGWLFHYPVLAVQNTEGLFYLLAVAQKDLMKTLKSPKVLFPIPLSALKVWSAHRSGCYGYGTIEDTSHM